MKNISAGLVSALLTFGVVAQAVAQAVPIADGAIVSPVSRTTVFVRDMDESLKLYRDILGLKPRVERTLDGEWWNELMGTKGKKVQVVILQTAKGEVVGNIGLFHFVDENPGPPVYSAARLQTGTVALVMVARDIHAVYEKVKAAGYTIISPPKTVDPKPSKASAYEMLFLDRDGIVVNIIQSGVK